MIIKSNFLASLTSLELHWGNCISVLVYVNAIHALQKTKASNVVSVGKTISARDISLCKADIIYYTFCDRVAREAVNRLNFSL